ncbi:hypothetical protein FHG87_003159 [Trinorchestia longiramus]|nr:hypothetical protein FHG87_003159 [Trinorchestia longiramus]
MKKAPKKLISWNARAFPQKLGVLWQSIYLLEERKGIVGRGTYVEWAMEESSNSSSSGSSSSSSSSSGSSSGSSSSGSATASIGVPVMLLIFERSGLPPKESWARFLRSVF